MTFLAGYPLWDLVTQNLWAWDVRGLFWGQTQSMSDEKFWHQLYWCEAHAKSEFDSDNRPGGPKNGISSRRSKTAALPCFPAKGIP
jgi:hypothetical protein